MTFDERIQTFLEKNPTIDPTAYLAPGSVLIGDVHLGPSTSVWPGAVLRADIQTIRIGKGSNVQDGAIVHLADDYPTLVGEYVTIGHHATIHACTIGDRCLIGMGATILDGAVIEEECIIGAHALVTQKTRIPAGSMVLGTPGKVVKTLSPEERAGLKAWADKYVAVSAAHRRVAGKTTLFQKS
ncbi:MAG: gamma carbonic anhydrase family protein [Verrucomicrobiota bacterium]